MHMGGGLLQLLLYLNLFVKKLLPVHFSGDCWLHGTSYNLPIVLKLRFRALIFAIHLSIHNNRICLFTDINRREEICFYYGQLRFINKDKVMLILDISKRVTIVMFCYYRFNHLNFHPSWNSSITRSIPRLLASWFDKNPSSSGSAERSTRQSSPTVLHWQILHA